MIIMSVDLGKARTGIAASEAIWLASCVYCIQP